MRSFVDLTINADYLEGVAFMKCKDCGNCLVCSKSKQIGSNLDQLSRDELIERLICAQNLTLSFQILIESLPDTFFVTDGEGKIILVNEAYEKLSMIDRKSILGRNMREYRGDVISDSATLMVLQAGHEITLEQRHYSSGRKSLVTSKPVFRNGKIQFVISSNRDFTEITSLQQKNTWGFLLSQGCGSNGKNHVTARKKDVQMIAEDPKTIETLRRAQKAAKTCVGILLVGETGTGKSELAKFIHKNSERGDRPFLTIDCGAITPALIESELFGYEKGAFTGARSEGRKGLLELGNGGTIFLDEIGELPLNLQVKLLRVLQEKEFYRIGGNQPVKVDVRFLCATNQDLQAMIAAKKFRDDLYYRLGAITLQIPPLRERIEDILPLALCFLQEINEEYGVQKELSPEAYQQLKKYDWPGNVRELKNVLEEAVIMSEYQVIGPTDIFPDQRRNVSSSVFQGGSVSEYLEQLEFRIYQEVYQRTGSVRKAAESLQMAPSTYSRKLLKLSEKYGMGASQEKKMS